MAVNYVNLKCLDPFISHFKNCVGCSYQYYKLQLFAHSGDLFITAISVWNGFGYLVFKQNMRMSCSLSWFQLG